MNLNFDREYIDYEDPAWAARCRKLTALWNSVSPEDARTLDTRRLLDHLELVEELMRFYTYKSDFQHLEPLMRSYEPMLKLLESRRPDTAGYWYLEMEYGRINALLYLDQGSIRQAMECFDQALVQSEHCFSRLQSEDGLYTAGQKLYLAWACAECRNETARTCERLTDYEKMYRILASLLPILQYMEDYYQDTDGIREKAAELYFGIGNICYQRKEFALGNSSYENARRLYDYLARKHDSNFSRARKIWIYAQQGIDAFAHAGNADIMQSCEREARQFLDSGAESRDLAIAQGALALSYMQKGAAFQQAGDLNTAIQWCEESVRLFDTALQTLEADREDLSRESARNMLTDISARLYASRLSAMNVLGVQYFYAGQGQDAGKIFERALSLLTDSGDYTISAGTSLIIRAESCEYLALLAADDADVNKTEFYSVQAMDFGEEAARITGNPAAWQIVVISASLAAEVANRMREKQKMGAFAARGLAACDELAKAVPDSEILPMRANLEKWDKKARRRFF